jgi:hypothetical protein
MPKPTPHRLSHWLFTTQVVHAGGEHATVVLPQTARSANPEQFWVPVQLLATPLNGEPQLVVAEQLKVEVLGAMVDSASSAVVRGCGSGDGSGWTAQPANPSNSTTDSNE